MLQSRKGFTLIELLIVITIIGILSVAFIPQLTGSQFRARDARRIADLQQIATALSLYADDHSGAYPATEACIADMTTELGPYLTNIPDDPLAGNAWAPGECSTASGGPGAGYAYIPMGDASGSATGFLIVAQLENVNTTLEGTYADDIVLTDTSLTAKEALALPTSVPCDGGDCDTEGAVYIYAR